MARDPQELRKAGLRHWTRCKALAARAGCEPGEVNMVWSFLCSHGLKPQDVDADTVTAIAVSYCRTLVLERRQRNAIAAVREEPDLRSRKSPTRLSCDSTTPEGRVRIMRWAIRKCGNVAFAVTAFDRARESLEEE